MFISKAVISNQRFDSKNSFFAFNVGLGICCFLKLNEGAAPPPHPQGPHQWLHYTSPPATLSCPYAQSYIVLGSCPCLCPILSQQFVYSSIRLYDLFCQLTFDKCIFLKCSYLSALLTLFRPLIPIAARASQILTYFQLLTQLVKEGFPKLRSAAGSSSNYTRTIVKQTKIKLNAVQIFVNLSSLYIWKNCDCSLLL